MKNIIIVCDSEAIAIRDYVEYIKNHLDCKISLFSWNVTNGKYDSEYSQMNVEVVNIYNRKIKSGLVRRLNRILILKKFSRNNKNIDIIHYQCLQSVQLKTLKHINKLAKSVILTYWGSDLFRSDAKEYRLLAKYFKAVNRITFMTDEMENKFHEIYGNDYDDKFVKHIDYGEGVYSYINGIKSGMTKAQCKAYWKIPMDKFVIHIGYNGDEEQQHDKIIEQLVKISQDYLENIYVVMHFGYGNHSDSYEGKVCDVLREHHISYKIIKDYLSKKEMAIFRCSADLFLYGQLTDAFSFSMSEYLYAGILMLKGSWLKYSVLDDMKIFYCEYDSFSDIPKVLVEIISNNVSRSESLEANVGKMYNYNSWEAMGTKWINLYESV